MFTRVASAAPYGHGVHGVVGARETQLRNSSAVSVTACLISSAALRQRKLFVTHDHYLNGFTGPCRGSAVASGLPSGGSQSLALFAGSCRTVDQECSSGHTTVLGHRCPRPVGGVLRQLFQRGDHDRFDLIDADVGGRPGLGSSASPSSRSARKRRRHLRTVSAVTRNSRATATIGGASGPAHASTSRARRARPCRCRSTRPPLQHRPLVIRQQQRLQLPAPTRD